MYRNIKTNTIKSNYNGSQAETPYAYEIEADIEALESIDIDELKETLKFIRPYSEDAYNKISLGTHKVSGEANVNVDAYAFGYGITDRLTIYTGIPIYKADVKLQYTKVRPSTEKDVADSYQSEVGNDTAQTIGQVAEKLFSIDVATIQSALVNTLEYNELGDWHGQGLGDIEFGLMYNFLREDNYGLKATFGGVAPTGYVDDPDILQDIGFGDGQWDAFVELGGGYKISNQITLNLWSRYTHQFASEKNLRVPLSEDVFISDEKDKFKVKLGDKFDIGVDSEIHLNDWFMLQPSYVINQVQRAQYSSSRGEVDDWLAKDSETSAHNIKLLAQLSSVNLFKEDKFLLPAAINISYQEMIQGKNTPKINRFEIELKMFF